MDDGVTGIFGASDRLRDLTADLMIEVRIRDRNGDPIRGFRAIDTIIAACSELNAALVPSAPPSLRTVLVIEDIDSHSVIAWLRQTPQSDTINESRTIQYANAAIVETVRWLSATRERRNFPELLQTLEALASKNHLASGIRHFKLDPAALLRALSELHAAQAALTGGDDVLLLTQNEGARIHASSRLSRRDFLRSAAAWQVKNDGVEMLFVIEAPDYSDENLWVAQHDGAPLEVRICDAAWLSDFKSRRIDVRKGDLVRAVTSTERYYTADGTPIDSETQITSVLEVVNPSRADLESRDAPATKMSAFRPIVLASPNEQPAE